jgi:hypothetical protein
MSELDLKALAVADAVMDEAGKNFPGVMRMAMRELGQQYLEAYLAAASNVPVMTRNDAAGFYEFVTSDKATISKPFEARTVEELRDLSERRLIGFRVWDVKP